MAGPLSGTIRAQPFTGDTGFKYTFQLVSEFFDGYSGYERIASYNGLMGSSFPDNVGIWCFGVWRTKSGSNTLDIFVGGVTGSSLEPPFGSPTHTPTNGQFIVNRSGDASFGIMVAWHSSSVAWNGTTNNDGNDSFTAHPWKTGSIILPPVNSTIGISSTVAYPVNAKNKNQCTAIFANSSFAGEYLTFVTDYDSFYISDNDISGNVNTYCCFQKYEPIESHSLPYILCGASVTNGFVYWDFPFESTNFQFDTDGTNGGGVFVNKNTNLLPLSASYSCGIQTPQWMKLANLYGSGSSLAFAAPSQSVFEAPGLIVGNQDQPEYFGYTTFMRATVGLPAGDVFGVSGSQRMVHGKASQDYVSCSIPWSTDFGIYGTVHTASSYFMTGSYFGVEHISASNLFPPIGGPKTKLYRYFSSGSYFYTTSPSGLETALTIVDEDINS